MRITIKTTGLDLTPPFNTYVETKLGRLGKLLQRMEKNQEFLLRVEVARSLKAIAGRATSYEHGLHGGIPQPRNLPPTGTSS